MQNTKNKNSFFIAHSFLLLFFFLFFFFFLSIFLNIISLIYTLLFLIDKSDKVYLLTSFAANPFELGSIKVIVITVGIMHLLSAVMATVMCEIVVLISRPAQYALQYARRSLCCN